MIRDTSLKVCIESSWNRKGFELLQSKWITRTNIHELYETKATDPEFAESVPFYWLYQTQQITVMIKMYQESMQKGNLPSSTTRNTKGVKYIKSYVKKVNEKEYYIAEGAVVPERSKKNKTHS